MSGLRSLCETCRWMREIVSAKGSRFLLCRKSLEDQRFAKYPPQPVMTCRGFETDRKMEGREIDPA